MPGRGMLPGGRVYDLIGQPLEVEPGSERDWSEGAVAWEWNALRRFSWSFLPQTYSARTADVSTGETPRN